MIQPETHYDCLFSDVSQKKKEKNKKKIYMSKKKKNRNVPNYLDLLMAKILIFFQFHSFGT